MRKVLLYICSVFILGGMTSCEDFLDKREDVGLTEDDIFRDYYSLRGFLDQSFNQLENVMVMDNWGKWTRICRSLCRRNGNYR
ncbi:SusD family [Bacteroides ovatus]|nr:SusD family [Bacteroides ovatus]SQC98169.1 SusD family [Bacteroides ovatus]